MVYQPSELWSSQILPDTRGALRMKITSSTLLLRLVSYREHLWNSPSYTNTCYDISLRKRLSNRQWKGAALLFCQVHCFHASFHYFLKADILFWWNIFILDESLERIIVVTRLITDIVEDIFFPQIFISRPKIDTKEHVLLFAVSLFGCSNKQAKHKP